MLSSPLRLFGLAVLVGLACCVPLVNAECATGRCAATPVYHPQTVVGTPIFVAPFEPLDVFVFVQPAVQPAQAQPPAGGPVEDLPAGFPAARGYAGKTAASRVDLKEVAAALTSCMACHTAPSGKSGVNIFGANGTFDPKVSPAAILKSVQNDEMPLRGVKLTPTQKNLLAAWVAATQKGPLP